MYVLLMMRSVKLLALYDLVTDLAEGFVRQISHVLATDDPALHFARVGNHGEKGPHVVKFIAYFVNLLVRHAGRVVTVESAVTP